MSQNLGQVLRKNQVKTVGSCRLDHDAVYAQPPQATAARPTSAAASSRSPQVRIVENTPQGVVLECTCSCGIKTYIQCDYKTEK
jgi:hypothetical protein